MVNVNDIKNGMTVEDEGNLYQVLDFSHVKPGKGAAFVKMKLKNLRTGAIVEKTYNSSVKLAKQWYKENQCNIYIKLVILIVLWI